MGSLEEVVSRKYLLIDTWEVRQQHLLIIGFSTLMFAVYWIFMWLLCSLTPSMATALLLLGSQIGLGLPATRTFYDFGVNARSKLKFYDAGVLGTDLDLVDLKMTIGETSLLFEHLDLQIRKYDSSALDDLNDLAWFTIIVWAVISSAGIFSMIAGVSTCTFGAFILMLACFVSYVSGYRTVQGFSFEEDLHHLEYYIQQSIKSLDDVLSKANGKIILQVTKVRRRTAIVDIIVEYTLSSTILIEYHLGLSSNQEERFIIMAPEESIDTLYSEFKDLELTKDSQWILEQITTRSGRILRIRNSKTTLSIRERSTFVVNPETVKRNIQDSRRVLKEILKILEDTTSYQKLT